MVVLDTPMVFLSFLSVPSDSLPRVVVDSRDFRLADRPPALLPILVKIDVFLRVSLSQRTLN